MSDHPIDDGDTKPPLRELLEDPAATEADQETETETFPLLKLPPELLRMVVSFVSDDKETIASLALVNRECHKLALEQQFATVELRINKLSSMELIFRLAQETLATKNFPDWSIGPHIREVKFDQGLEDGLQFPPKAALVKLEKQVSRAFKAISIAESKDKKVLSAHRACEALLRDLDMYASVLDEDEYWDWAPANQCRISIPLVVYCAMPNLAIFQWDHEVFSETKSWSTLNSTACAGNLHTLKMDVLVDERHYSRMTLRAGSWSLQSLDLTLRFKFLMSGEEAEMSDTEGQTDNLITQLLKACAPTLRKLTLCLDREPPAAQPRTASIVFPSLKELTIKFPIRVPGVLSSLLISPVRRSRFESDSSFSRYSAALACSDMPELENTDIPPLKNAQEAIQAIRFLNKHRHIKRLHLPDDCEYQALNEHIVPYLATGKLSSLTSLSLVWVTEGHPETPRQVAINTLDSIAQIRTLQYLHLLARGACDVTHHDVKLHLQGLKELKLLAISGDTDYLLFNRVSNIDNPIRVTEDGMYGCLKDMHLLRADPDLDDRLKLFEDRDLEGYQSGVWCREQDGIFSSLDHLFGPINDRYCSLDADTLDDILHRNSVLSEAETYARLFPKLRSIYFGRMLMDLWGPGVWKEYNAFPHYEGMDKFPSKMVFETTEPEEFCSCPSCQ